MNSVATAKSEGEHLLNMFTFSQGRYAGGAIGSAFMVANKLNLTSERFIMEAIGGLNSPTHTTKTSFEEQRIIEIRKMSEVELIKNNDELCEKVSETIILGDVVGWFQGRMEWGPRALGNRSHSWGPQTCRHEGYLKFKIKRREFL